MIVTSKKNEMPEYSRVIGGDAQVWRSIDLEREAPYFMVIYSVQESLARVRQTSLLWNEKDLISLCDQFQEDPNIDLIRVCVLSPPWMNNTNVWKLDPIREIWNAIHCRMGIGVWYVLENGGDLFDSPSPSEACEWAQVDSIFRISEYMVISDFDSGPMH